MYGVYSKYAGKLSFVDTNVSPALHPVCIYMREEITGEFALRETQLRTLGLLGGKAVIRLVLATTTTVI